MNTKYLNYASDLRRIAEWAAKGQKEMYPLASRLLYNVQKNSKVKSILKRYQVDIDPLAIANGTKERLFFAEQVLLASIMLS